MRLYLVCPECNHVYRTRFNLVFDLLKMLWEVNHRVEPSDRISICWIRRPKHIYFCPNCNHDF